MSKPKSIPTAEAQAAASHRRPKHDHDSGPEPLSGSKKVKQRNHVDHLNRQG